MNIYGQIASGLVNFEFPKETGAPTVGEVSGWLEINIGQLNTRLGSEFSGTNPTIDNMAQSIFAKMYMEHYFTRQSRRALYDITSSVGTDFITLKEGDTVITRTNRNEVSKTYRGLANDYSDQLTLLQGQYRMYLADPIQVIPTIPLYDFGSFSNTGTY